MCASARSVCVPMCAACLTCGRAFSAAASPASTLTTDLTTDTAVQHQQGRVALLPCFHCLERRLPLHHLNAFSSSLPPHHHQYTPTQSTFQLRLFLPVPFSAYPCLFLPIYASFLPTPSSAPAGQPTPSPAQAAQQQSMQPSQNISVAQASATAYHYQSQVGVSLHRPSEHVWGVCLARVGVCV